jgi:hypothetical protein
MYNKYSIPKHVPSCKLSILLHRKIECPIYARRMAGNIRTALPRVEVGYNTSIGALRNVEGDEKETRCLGV